MSRQVYFHLYRYRALYHTLGGTISTILILLLILFLLSLIIGLRKTLSERGLRFLTASFTKFLPQGRGSSSPFCCLSLFSCSALLKPFNFPRSLCSCELPRWFPPLSLCLCSTPAFQPVLSFRDRLRTGGSMFGILSGFQQSRADLTGSCCRVGWAHEAGHYASKNAQHLGTGRATGPFAE